MSGNGVGGSGAEARRSPVRVTGGWSEWATEQCAAIRQAGQWREIRDFDARGPQGRLAPDGRETVSFASNDYLGLSAHPSVIAAARGALDRWGTGAGAARLIVGSRPVHSELEAKIAEWKGAEQALLLPTGFAANLAVLATLGDPETVICSDELNHASIIDGCRLARARVEIYPHRDLDALSSLLRRVGRAIVVSELVFSMDGDVVPGDELIGLCAEHGALLVIDEAHVVLGPRLDPGGADVLRVGTLSKALGSLGGFVAGPAPLVELLRNRARSFIFTTAAPPATAAAALEALRIVGSPEGGELRGRLRDRVDRLRAGHPSPIIPVVIGDEEPALRAAAALLDRGFLVPAIRPPTVPAGTSRLRVTVSAAHTEEQVDAIADALREIGIA